MNVSCPHCRASVLNDPEIANQVVSCPHCVRQFTMPPWQELIIPRGEQAYVQDRSQQVQPQPQIQPIVVVTGGGQLAAPSTVKYRPRLKATGWFTRSFGAAGGFFLCAFLFVVATCGGAWYWVRWNVASTIDAVAESMELTQKQGKVLAEKLVKSHGITELSDNVTVLQLGDDWMVSGAGLDRDGETHDVSVRIQVATFGKKKKIELKALFIDGEQEHP